MKKLIQAGGDVNEQDGYGSTPLHEASREGHVEVVAELLKLGANVDAATKVKPKIFINTR